MKKMFATIVMLAFMSVASASMAESDVVVIATDPTNPPMQMLDSTKKIVGFDIDIMNEAAKAGGFKANFIPIVWDDIFSGLLQGNYDAIMSSVTITSERKQTMDFTVPYLVVGQVLLVRSNEKPVGSFEDLSRRVVGVLSGSASETELNKVSQSNSISVERYSDLSPMFADLVGGKIDAFFCDDYYASAAVKSTDPKYKDRMKIAGPALTYEYFGIAVKKGNVKVLNMLNAGLRKVLASEEYSAILERWLK